LEDTNLKLASVATDIVGLSARAMLEMSAMERWEEHCQKWQAWAAEKGMGVEFGYIGESELLAALTLPSQAGRAYYWFNGTVLTQE
jgi:hypothetical protein